MTTLTSNVASVCNLFGYNPTATRLFGEYILDIPKASMDDVSVVAEYMGSGIVYKHFRMNKKSTILDVKKELNDYVLLLNNDQKDEMILGDLKKDEITFVIRIKNEEDYYLDELKTKTKLTLEMMHNSAKKGYLNCLKYLYENGCSWNSATCYSAAQYGHLEVLRYAHENGCSWDSYTCTGAAKNGHLDCLKYAIENKCPHSKHELRKIAKKHKHILNYLDQLHKHRDECIIS